MLLKWAKIQTSMKRHTERYSGIAVSWEIHNQPLHYYFTMPVSARRNLDCFSPQAGSREDWITPAICFWWDHWGIWLIWQEEEEEEDFRSFWEIVGPDLFIDACVWSPPPPAALKQKQKNTHTIKRKKVMLSTVIDLTWCTLLICTPSTPDSAGHPTDACDDTDRHQPAITIVTLIRPLSAVTPHHAC